MVYRIRLLVPVVLLMMAVVLVACPSPQGGGATQRATEEATEEPTDEATEEPTAEETEEATEEPTDEETEEPVVGEGCPADLVEVDPDATHVDEGTTVEYETNPPAGGPHWGSAAEDGVIYGPIEESGYVLEQFVHNMEHGSVVFWTNNLSDAERELAEATVNDIYGQGYYALIMVEYNDMDVPFAMTAWGVLQECESMDETTAQVMQLFTDFFYGSGAEGFFACDESVEPAVTELLGCEKWLAEEGG